MMFDFMSYYILGILLLYKSFSTKKQENIRESDRTLILNADKNPF